MLECRKVKCNRAKKCGNNKIRNNISFFYYCGAENKVYILPDTCGELSEFPEKLFDLPFEKRETAASEYLKLEVLNESEGNVNHI